MPNDLFLLIGRLLIAALFILSGYQALSDIAGAADYFGRLGLPLPVLAAWGVGLFEVFFGLLVLIGFQTRVVVLPLALFAVSAGYIGHFGQGGDNAMLATMHSQAFMKDLAVAGGLLALAAAGAGAYSLDARRR